jgi:hypothetical protein
MVCGMLQRVHDLDIDEDVNFSRRAWLVQRVSFWVMALVLIASALGLLGNGALARRDAHDPTGQLHVRYDGLVQASSTSHLTLTVRPQTPGTVTLWISEPYLGGVEVQTMTPEPTRSWLDDGRVVYAFAAAPSATAVTIRVALRPHSPGRSNATIGLVDGPAVRLRQFVYP